jgi:hypothetical protein
VLSREVSIYTSVGSLISCSAAGSDLRSQLDEQTAWTVGIYHDVIPWFKVVAEYSNVEREWFNNQDQENDVFAIGGFFSW